MSRAFDRLIGIMDRLRDPGGCPWDREQTMESLAGYLLEETYEVVEAVRSGDASKLREELGDLLMQVVFMARIASEQGAFDADGVCDTISDKMVRRHPHVFADRVVSGPGEVLRNWEEIKSQERAADRGGSTLDGVPAALPALLKAFRVTEKAAAVGFDWRRPKDVVAKLREEVEEVGVELESGNAATNAKVRSEMGDVLFAMANLSRHLGVEPETALQEANSKFISRFRAVEARAAMTGRRLRDLSLKEMDRLWEEVKAEEDETRR